MGADETDSLTDILSVWGIVCASADSDTEVFRHVREEEPDLLILGSHLQGEMNAGQVCGVIKADPLLQATQILMLSESELAEDLRGAIWAGADGWVSLSFSPDEIRTRILPCLRNRSTYRQLQIANERFQKLFVELRALSREKERDLREGSTFQSSLLPGPEELQEEFARLELEISIFHAPFPGAEVSGDFWDIYRLGPDATGFLLADAVGHGIRAAFYSMYTLSALRKTIGPGPQDFLKRHSEELYGIMKGTHLAALYCRFERDRVLVTNAGMPSPMLLHEGSARSLELYGPVLGGFPQSPTYSSVPVELQKGDVLILCSDGILEAKNAAGQEFGVERLLEAAESTLPEAEPVNMAIMGSLLRFAGDSGMHDDASMVILHRR